MGEVPELKFLRRISELRRRPSCEGWDIRGYRVLDAEAKEVGRVSDLLLDPETDRVRFVEIKTGGAQERSLVIAFHQVTVIGQDRVILPARLEDLEQTPR